MAPEAAASGAPGPERAKPRSWPASRIDSKRRGFFMTSPTERVFQVLCKDREVHALALAGFTRQVVGDRASRQEVDHWLKNMVDGLCREFPQWLPGLEGDQVDWRRLTEYYCTCYYSSRARQRPPDDPPNAYWMGEVLAAGNTALHPQRARPIFETVPVQMLPLEEKLLALGGSRVVYSGEPHLAELLARGQVVEGAARRVPGRPCQCHMNAADLWDAHREHLAIATGYALSTDGLWRQHSWNLRTHPTPRQRRIIETTERRVRYFGFTLNAVEADVFCRLNGSGSDFFEFLDRQEGVGTSAGSGWA